MFNGLEQLLCGLQLPHLGLFSLGGKASKEGGCDTAVENYVWCRKSNTRTQGLPGKLSVGRGTDKAKRFLTLCKVTQCTLLPQDVAINLESVKRE